ncbi:MAG: acyl-CoA thioesterase domain-containing protein, partial [Cryobacterium sp.]
MEGLLAALDLTDTGARTSEDIFTGVSQWMPHGRVFGGQVLAQSLVAAMRTVSDERHVHSMHGY